MENLNLAFVSSTKTILRYVFRRKPFFFGRVLVAPSHSRYRVSALSPSHVNGAASQSQQNPKSEAQVIHAGKHFASFSSSRAVQEKLITKHFASISSSSSPETTSVGVSPQLSPPPSSTIWSPEFWISICVGVGVGLAAPFSLASKNGAPSKQGFGDSPGSQSTHQIGPSPEEVIMANHEVVMAFQNPKVQAAVMDHSQNPPNIANHQNDEELQLSGSRNITLSFGNQCDVTVNNYDNNYDNNQNHGTTGSFNNRRNGHQIFSAANIDSGKSRRGRAICKHCFRQQ